MCGSMADIQSAAAEIRRGKKKKKKKKNKPQHENIYGLPIPQGDHKKNIKHCLPCQYLSLSNLQYFSISNVFKV